MSMTINDLKNKLCKHILFLICYSEIYLKNSMENVYIFYSDKLCKYNCIQINNKCFH